MYKFISFILLSTLTPCLIFSQDIIRLGERTVNKVERKVESGINRGIDRTLNDAEKEIRNSTKSKKDSKSGSKSGSSGAGKDEPTGVQEKYDFKPLGNTIYTFQADKLADQSQSAQYFSQETEIVSLEGQKSKWIKLEPNMAYSLVQNTPVTEDYAIETILIPQLNFDNNEAIHVGFIIAGESVMSELTDNPNLEPGTTDSLESYTIVTLNKSKGKEDLNVTVKTKKKGATKPIIKNMRYYPAEASDNKNTFAILRNGSITKLYYCNRKITSFQDADKEPRKVALFVDDSSSGSSLYVQQINITTP